MIEIARQVETLRPQLLRYARSQLRNDAWAEDAVSEAMLAALEKPQSFAGQSQLKTWLVGILKHKIIDAIRQRSREVSSDPDDAGDGQDELDALVFKADGHWREAPQEWGSPEQTLNQRQFFEVLEQCMEHLPATQGRVFMMREWLELGTDEICKELSITSTNLWVLLHRARLRLRDCLQQGWFAGRPVT